MSAIFLKLSININKKKISKKINKDKYMSKMENLREILSNKFYLLASKLSRLISRNNIFVKAEDYRSDSDNGRYLSIILNIIKNPKIFNNFKRSYAYREILEHVSKAEGYEYLNILKSRSDGILDKALDTVLVSDTLGNPIKYLYPNQSKPLSPTTLRYLKVASDLKIMFGENLGCVAEIGCGYGGQALINDQLLNVRQAKLFDLPLVNELVKLYLNNYLFNGSYYTAFINEEGENEYNLVISNYAFSELPKKLQLKYIVKVISKAHSGYLTMNSGLEGSRSEGKLSIYELRELLPDFKIFEEEPLTFPNNYIIAWGFNEHNTFKHFIEKKELLS